ncbi:glycosyl hydrolase family 95 catalytic domain-containing protein [Eubacterium sp.]|uniref:glycosyl hydrolase family 95 catalytic domain-containing protein n=1 Tax=Eubacterium sp. TaxID=142586 RepID=UPI003EFE5053
MKHTVVITAKPERSGKESIPDGAVTGNGDLSVMLGNSEKGLRAFIAKCDLWKANEHPDSDGGIKPLGYVDFNICQKLYDNYYVEQRMDEGELFCRFADEKNYVEIKIMVCAVKNDIFFEITASDETLVSKPRFTVFNCNADKFEDEYCDDIHIITRCFQNDELGFNCKVSAGISEFAKDRYVLCAATNFDSDTFEKDVSEHLSEFSEEIYQYEKDRHYEWWKDFYGKSTFCLSDEELEMNWYACQYHLAICARNTKFPPGIYGNFITTETERWHGDYHLNYNYEAPFYAVFSSNHPELSDCYFAPLEQFVPRGREYASKYLNCNGIFYPVGLLPMGLFSEYRDNPDEYEKMFLGQKSNASYAAVIMVMRWNSTKDTEFAKTHIYPYLKAVGEFWEDFLVFENGRYVICDDAIHEVPYYIDNFKPFAYKKHIHAKNNLLSLGLVRMVFKTLLELSNELNVDEDKREKWQHIVAHISDYPTFYKKFKKVFRYTEKGMAWHNGNFLCLQHVYPVGQVDLNNNPQMLKIAKNTFSINDRWLDDNATNSVFPCAVRLGINPHLIIEKLKLNYKKFQQPNLLMLHGGGCLENCSLTASSLNEMALQSYDGIIRIFPNWDSNISCHFKNLRADGAFLVSAKFEKGNISDIEIFSENGGKATLKNPYDKCVLSNDKSVIYNRELIEISLEKGQRISVEKA